LHSQLQCLLTRVWQYLSLFVADDSYKSSHPFSIFCFPSSSPPDTGSFRFILTNKSYRVSCGYIVSRALNQNVAILAHLDRDNLRKSWFKKEPCEITILGHFSILLLNILQSDFVSHSCLQQSARRISRRISAPLKYSDFPLFTSARYFLHKK